MLDMYVYTRVCNMFISQYLDHVKIVLISAQSTLTHRVTGNASDSILQLPPVS